MTLYFIIPMLIGNVGAAAIAAWQGKWDLTLAMLAGAFAQGSAYLMAVRT